MLKKSDKVHIRAERSEYNGNESIAVREWYCKNGEWMRTQKGFTIPLDDAPGFAKKLHEAIKGLL